MAFNRDRNKLTVAFLTAVGLFLVSATSLAQQEPINSCTDSLDIEANARLATVDASASAEERFNSIYRAFSAAREEGRKAESIELGLTAIKLGRPRLDARQMAKMDHNVALALLVGGKVIEAKNVFRCVDKVYERLHGSDSLERAGVQLELARIARLRFDKTSAWRERQYRYHAGVALDIVKTAKGDDSKEYAGHLFSIADILTATGGSDRQIERYYSEALDIYRQASGPNDPAVGIAAYKLGSLHWKRAATSEPDAAKAEEHLQFAIDNLQEHSELNAWLTKARSILMFVYAATNKEEQALQQCLLLRKEGALPDVQDVTKDHLPIIRVEPVYPPRLARSRTEGFAVVQFDLDILGKPLNITVADWAGSELFGEAATTAVRRWRFPPRCSDDRLTPTEGLATQLTFRMAD